MAAAKIVSICTLQSLRIPVEKHVSKLWRSRFQGRARFNTKKMRRSSHIPGIILPQHGRDIENPCRCKYRGHFNPNIADKEKEEAMKFRRTVYDHENWRRHRSSTRHARHLLSIATSGVVYAIWPPVLSLTSIATLTTGYNEAVVARVFPNWMPLLHLSTLPLSFTASACLSLLLVFRTNSSYTRFGEARQAWATTVCRSRDMVRQALTWMQHPADRQKLQTFQSYAASFPYTLKNMLVEDTDIKTELSSFMDADDMEAILNATHPCNYVLQILSEIVHDSVMCDTEKSMIDMNISQLHESLGTCERLFATPLPLSYTRLTSRFLIIWHIILPLALWDPCNWIAVPATFISASALFCIDEVGVLIEEPFPLLALPDICDDIRKSIANLVAAHDQLHHVQTPTATSEKP